jgi:hypothetical protein
VLAALEQARSRKPTQAVSAVAGFWDGAHGKGSASVGVWFHRAHETRPHALTIGRHPICEVAPVPGAALRHAVLLLWPPTDAVGPRVELIDLVAGSQVAAGGAFTEASASTPVVCRFSLPSADIVVLQATPGVSLCPEGPGAAAAKVTAPASHRSPALEAELFESDEPTRPDRFALAPDEQMIGFVDPNGVVRDTLGLPLTGHTPPLRVAVPDRALQQPIWLGRHPRCVTRSALRNRPTVSRIHACIIERRGGLWLIDCASRNGTEVIDARNGGRTALGPGTRALRLGPHHRIKLGEQELRLAPGPRAERLLHSDERVALHPQTAR